MFGQNSLSIKDLESNKNLEGASVLCLLDDSGSISDIKPLAIH